MRGSVATGRGERAIYRAAGRPCPRCQTLVASWGQGDGNRTAYWCPSCQPGPEPRREECTDRRARNRTGDPSAPPPSGAARVLPRPRSRRLFRELDEGGELPFAFEEHQGAGRPTLYEYRPLVRPFLEARAGRLAALADAQVALAELEREPAAAIFARAHAAGGRARATRCCERCCCRCWRRPPRPAAGSTGATRRSSAPTPGSRPRFSGPQRSYGAVAPVRRTLDRRRDRARRGSATFATSRSGELASHWPQARGLLPDGFEREPDRLCVLELEQALPPRRAASLPTRPVSWRTR